MIKEMIVGIENREGKRKVGLKEKESLERMLKGLEGWEVYIWGGGMDWG